MNVPEYTNFRVIRSLRGTHKCFSLDILPTCVHMDCLPCGWSLEQFVTFVATLSIERFGMNESDLVSHVRPLFLFITSSSLLGMWFV